MKTEQNIDIKTRIIWYAISVAVGFVVTFVFMLVLAAISVALDLPESAASPISSVTAAAGGLVASFISSKKIGSGGLINGLICGFAIFLIITLVALILDDGGLSMATLFHLVVLVLSSLIGGIWGVNSGQKKLI